MQSTRRRCSTALLILLYVAGTATLFTSYFALYHRQSFQAQVKQAKDSDLERLFFSFEEYESIDWIEDESEFEWKGKMYDVSHIEKTAKGYEIVCENDELEEMLIAFLKKTKGGSDQPIKKGNLQPQFFSTYILNYSTATFIIETDTQSRFYFAYRSLSMEVLSPPPEAVS